MEIVLAQRITNPIKIAIKLKISIFDFNYTRFTTYSHKKELNKIIINLDILFVIFKNLNQSHNFLFVLNYLKYVYILYYIVKI